MIALITAASRPFVQVLCWLVEPVSTVIQSLSSSALTDLLQELQCNEGQLTSVLHNKVSSRERTPPPSAADSRPSLPL